MFEVSEFIVVRPGWDKAVFLLNRSSRECDGISFVACRRTGSGGPPLRRDSRGSSGAIASGAPIRRTSAGREPLGRSSSWSRDQPLRSMPQSSPSPPVRSMGSPSLQPAEAMKFSTEVLEKKVEALLQEYLAVRDLEVCVIVDHGIATFVFFIVVFCSVLLPTGAGSRGLRARVVIAWLPCRDGDVNAQHVPGED